MEWVVFAVAAVVFLITVAVVYWANRRHGTGRDEYEPYWQ